MATITSGATTVTPDSVSDYSSTRESGNVIHRILGSEDVDVTLRPAYLRRGTLEYSFTDADDAVTVESLHSNAATVTLGGSITSVDMTYVVDGRCERRRNNTGRWTVTIDYQEVDV